MNKANKMLNGQPHGKHIVPLVVVLVLGSQTALGAQWSAVPGLQLRAVHDDNPYLATGSHSTAIGNTVSPQLSLSRREENQSLSLTGRLIFNRYSGSEYRDTNVQILTLSSHYKTERDAWNLKAGYTGNTTMTTVNGATDSTDIDVNLVPVEVKRKRFDVRPSWTHRLSKQSSLTLNYRFREVSYENTVNTGLVGYQQNGFEAAVGHRVTEKDRLSAIVQASLYEARNGGGVDSADYGARVNWHHQYSQTLSGDAAVGVRETISKLGQQENKSNGLLVNAGLVKRYSELTTYRVILQRAIQPSGGGQVVQSDQLRAQWSRKLSPKMAVYFWAIGFRNESVDQPSSTLDRTYYSLEPGLRWILSRKWSLDASYRYRSQKYKNASQSADGNAVFIAASYAWPLIAVSR